MQIPTLVKRVQKTNQSINLHYLCFYLLIVIILVRYAKKAQLLQLWGRTNKQGTNPACPGKLTHTPDIAGQSESEEA